MTEFNPNCGKCGMLNSRGFCSLTACRYPSNVIAVQPVNVPFVPKPTTNADRIRAMSDEKLANQLVSEQYVAMKMVLTLLCQKLEEEEILDEKETKELFCDFENEAKKRWSEMVKEKLEWLKSKEE